MSLINRMLRDLASRQPPSGEMLSGIRLPHESPPQPPATRWGALAIVALLGLAVVVGLRPVLVKRAALPVPTPRGGPAGSAGVSAAPAASTASAAAMAALAPPPGRGARFHFDNKLSPSTGTGPAPAVAEPRAKLQLQQRLSRHRARSAGSAPAPAVGTVAPAVEAPAPVASAAPVTSARNARASEQRAAQGGEAQAAGQVKSAEQQYRDALALNPANHEARERLATLLLDQNRLKEAKDVIDEGLLLEPMRNSFRRLAARLDLAQGAPGAAVQRLEPNAPAVDDDPEYHALLAQGYQRMGLHEAAAHTYEALLQLHPDEGNWWAGYGISQEALGRPRAALDAYQRARQMGKLDPRVRDYITKRSAALQNPKG